MYSRYIWIDDSNILVITATTIIPPGLGHPLWPLWGPWRTWIPRSRSLTRPTRTWWICSPRRANMTPSLSGGHRMWICFDELVKIPIHFRKSIQHRLGQPKVSLQVLLWSCRKLIAHLPMYSCEPGCLRNITKDCVFQMSHIEIPFCLSCSLAWSWARALALPPGQWRSLLSQRRSQKLQLPHPRAKSARWSMRMRMWIPWWSLCLLRLGRERFSSERRSRLKQRSCDQLLYVSGPSAGCWKQLSSTVQGLYWISCWWIQRLTLERWHSGGCGALRRDPLDEALRKCGQTCRHRLDTFSMNTPLEHVWCHFYDLITADLLCT